MTDSPLDPQIAALLKRDAAGLLPAVIQDARSGDVLMVGWMDDAALQQTLTSGRTTFFSRSRQEYWVKGETSGHHQWVREVRLDCDGDTVLVKVDQVGAACHTGDRTCFDARQLPSVSVHPPLVRGGLGGSAPPAVEPPLVRGGSGGSTPPAVEQGAAR